jgi:hypothetical protein
MAAFEWTHDTSRRFYNVLETEAYLPDGHVLDSGKSR